MCLNLDGRGFRVTTGIVLSMEPLSLRFVGIQLDILGKLSAWDSSLSIIIVSAQPDAGGGGQSGISHPYVDGLGVT